MDDEADSFQTGHTSDSDAREAIDGDADLLRYGPHGVSSLWRASTQSGGGVAAGCAFVSKEMLALRQVGPATTELSRRLREPTPQCPYTHGRIPPEVLRAWSIEAADAAEKGRAARRGVAASHRGGGGNGGERLKLRLRTTVWAMGDVAAALRALHHVGHLGHNPTPTDRPLAPFSYQHSILRSGATGGYSLLLHPDTLVRLRSATAAAPHAPAAFNAIFTTPGPTSNRAARGSGIGSFPGLLGCPVPTAASALRTLRPVAASARWAQALILSIEGDVYQWRVSSSGQLLNEDDGEAGGDGRSQSRGASFTTPSGIGTAPVAGEDAGGGASSGLGAGAGGEPTVLALPAAPTPATPHPRFFSVSDRVVVTEGGGAATEATAVSLGPQLVTPFCLLRALSGVRVAAVACGTLHCVALTFAPTCDVYTWGSGSAGRLGHGSDTDELAPRLVEELLPYRVTAIAAGATHTAALTSGTLALLAQVRPHGRPWVTGMRQSTPPSSLFPLCRSNGSVQLPSTGAPVTPPPPQPMLMLL